MIGSTDFSLNKAQMCIAFESGGAVITMYIFSLDFSTETGLIPSVEAAVSSSTGCPSTWKYEISAS